MMIKSLLLVSVSVSFIVLNASGQVKVIKETKQESKVCNLIASLPEVINADNYVKKMSKGKTPSCHFYREWSD